MQNTSLCTRDGRDRLGRFVKGNTASSAGGVARAAVLTPERRREIAQRGFWGLVIKHFGGDRQRAVAYIGALGAWACEVTAYGDSPIFKRCFVKPIAPWEIAGECIGYEDQCEAVGRGLYPVPF